MNADQTGYAQGNDAARGPLPGRHGDGNAGPVRVCWAMPDIWERPPQAADVAGRGEEWFAQSAVRSCRRGAPLSRPRPNM